MKTTVIVAAARTWIGTPYCHQASVKGVGADCLGLVRGVWRDSLGPEPEAVPPYRPDWQAGEGDLIMSAFCRHLIQVDKTDLRPGHVLIFGTEVGQPARHCAILGSADTIVHAYWRRGVCETALVPWWQKRICGVFRYPDGV